MVLEVGRMSSKFTVCDMMQYEFSVVQVKGERKMTFCNCS